MVALAQAMTERAPDAWLVNFTNPAGMVTEAVRPVLGDRAIGVCDSPRGLCRRVARALGRERLWFDYYGLNHLGWLGAVREVRRDLLPGLLADDAALASFEEGRLFGADWLRTLGAIPNEYLYYFYFTAEAVAALGREARGELLRRGRDDFYAGDGDALAAWRATRAQRERTYMAEAGMERDDEPDGGGYEGEAMAVVDAIAADAGSVRDPQHREPRCAALPGRRRGGRGAVRRHAPVARTRSPWGRCPRTPRRSSARSRRWSGRRSPRRCPAPPVSRSRRWRCTRSSRASPRRARSSPGTVPGCPAGGALLVSICEAMLIATGRPTLDANDGGRP